MTNQQIIDYYNTYLSYQSNGDLIWKKTRGGQAIIGNIAGNDNGKGHLQIGIRCNGRLNMILNHRLIFLIHHGWLPRKVDHSDTNRRNNKIINLRPATSSQNSQNSNKRKDNTSGYKGVSLRKDTNKYAAYLYINKKRIHLGFFDCPIEAAKSYDKEAKERFGTFARLNFKD